MKPYFALLAALILAAVPVHAQDTNTDAVPAGLQSAYFAGGCFWCMQFAFDKVNGVKKNSGRIHRW